MMQIGFEIIKNNESLATFKTRLFGQHNLLNALAVIAIADRLKIPLPIPRNEAHCEPYSFSTIFLKATERRSSGSCIRAMRRWS